ncbi:hypothetical protein B7R54_04680 [Subtercola boreus]|uniref:TfoX N-terminal domain-containing protein n=1 Tax=Subtercola boreus TaxID=120213 RepID=A0A3E0VFU7_9MICO|nr:hypothetical protein [Subtercola boreus]RFA08601.1 hypothetical protein B7R54_04680 [Subtercola boreus]TQL54462.1 hypothetical protein FB464_2001 [Subtercola boreus]
MPTPDEAFEALGGELRAQGAERGRMMGRPMYAVNGKMFACLSNERLAVRLGAGTAALDIALALPGATLFHPGDSNRTWRDWAALPLSAASAWPEFAGQALHNRLE